MKSELAGNCAKSMESTSPVSCALDNLSAIALPLSKARLRGFQTTYRGRYARCKFVAFSLVVSKRAHKRLISRGSLCEGPELELIRPQFVRHLCSVSSSDRVGLPGGAGCVRPQWANARAPTPPESWKAMFATCWALKPVVVRAAGHSMLRSLSAAEPMSVLVLTA